MESGKMKKMMKQIEDMMAAVSFAEEGEADAAQYLFQRERRLLLALKEGRIDAKTMKYALNSALRIKANLDILYINAPDAPADPRLRDFEAELESAGIAYRLIRRSGCLKQAIIDYTDKEREILFVVVESPVSLDADCRKKDSALSELWSKLRCPLVVVAEAAKA